MPVALVIRVIRVSTYVMAVTMILIAPTMIDTIPIVRVSRVSRVIWVINLITIDTRSIGLLGLLALLGLLGLEQSRSYSYIPPKHQSSV